MREEKSTRLSLLIILAVSFGLRIFGNQHGLPSIRLGGIEEDLIVERGMGILLGYTPAIQWPGTLYMLLFAILGGTVFVLTHIMQFYRALHANMFEVIRVVDDFYIDFFKDPSSYYIVARYFQAVISTGTAYLIYQLGRELKEEKGGLIGAALWAVAPMSIYCGHVVNVDELMLLLLLWSLLLSIRYRNGGETKLIYWAGVLTGLSVASKFNGLFGLVAIFWSVSSRAVANKEPFWPKAAKTCAAATGYSALGFVLGCPYVLTVPPAVAKFFLFRAALRTIAMDVTSGYWLALAKHIPEGFGWIPMIAGISGLTLLAFRKKGKELPLIFAVVYFIAIGRIQTLYQQHMFPLAALISLGAGVALWSSYTWMKAKSPRYALLISLPVIFAVIYAPARTTYGLERRFILPDTREIARQWIEANIPAGSRLLLTGFGNPKLYDSPESLKRQLESLRSDTLLQEQYLVFREFVGIRSGGKWKQSILPGDKFPFLAMSQGLTIEEEFDKARLLFLMADPNPPQPSYEIFHAQPLLIKPGDFVKRTEQGEFDMVLIHPIEARKGPYAQLREAAVKMGAKMKPFMPVKNKIVGAPLEIYIFQKTENREPSPIH